MATDRHASTEDSHELRQVVDDFIEEIQNTIERSLVCEFEVSNSYVKASAQTIGTSGGRFKIGYDLAINAKVDGRSTYRLEATYILVWNQMKRFPAVYQSSFSLYLEGSGEPLFHYDYLREPRGNIPGAHLNIHHDREDLRQALARCGGNYRGKSKQRSLAAGGTIRDSELHYPLGGPRFRPALEDIVQFMIYELGVDTQDEWKSVLDRGRAAWRDRQLRAAVTDNLHSAAEVLRDHGFTVSGGPPSDRNNRRITEL